MKGLYRMQFDCGARTGKLEGIFVANKEDVDYLTKNKIEIHFGEVAGKHSDVYGPIDDKEIEFITDDEKVISLFTEFKLETGYNPFNYPVAYFAHYNMPEEEFVDLSVKKAIDKLRKLNA